MGILEALQEVLGALFLRRFKYPWLVYVLIVIAIFVLASRYVVPLVQAVHDWGGVDG